MKHIIFFDKEADQKRINAITEEINNSGYDDWTKHIKMTSIFNRFNHKYLLFFALGEFIIVEYNEENLRQGYDSHPDFILKIVEACYINSKVKIVARNTVKSVRLDDRDFRRTKNVIELLETAYNEVNYLYSNNAGKRYAIVTELLTLDLINKNYYKEYNDTLQYISKNNIRIDIEELRDLYIHQSSAYVNEKTIAKSIDQLISNIKTEIQ